ncbi:RHS repeat domain-containing protein [Streptomyces sp. M10(2022)]
MTTPDGAVWRYQYDPLGRRTAKQRLADDGSTILEQTSFTWDDANLCEQLASGEGLPNPVMLTWDHEGMRPWPNRNEYFQGSRRKRPSMNDSSLSSRI